LRLASVVRGKWRDTRASQLFLPLPAPDMTAKRPQLPPIRGLSSLEAEMYYAESELLAVMKQSLRDLEKAQAHSPEDFEINGPRCSLLQKIDELQKQSSDDEEMAASWRTRVRRNCLEYSNST
jgi:hypothetical protein